MSILQVANVQFETTGSNRIDYTGNNTINFVSQNTYFTGNISVTSTVSATHFDNVSDITLKENVESIEYPMDVLSNLNPVSFTWKKDGSKSFGLIAQEVEPVLPDIVHELGDIKTVSYIQLIPFLISVIQKQQKEIDIINNKLSDLTKPNA